MQVKCSSKVYGLSLRFPEIRLGASTLAQDAWPAHLCSISDLLPGICRMIVNPIQPCYQDKQHGILSTDSENEGLCCAVHGPRMFHLDIR